MDTKLNHSDLTSLLAKNTKLTAAKAELFTKTFFDIIIEGLEKDGLVKINGLGTFKVTDVASRGSVNVNTGEKIEIKGHRKLTFLPADTLKEKVNKPFAMFEPVEIDDSYVDDDATIQEDAEEIVPTAVVLEVASETVEPVEAVVEEETETAAAEEEEAVVESAPVAECAEEISAPVAEEPAAEPVNVAHADAEKPVRKGGNKITCLVIVLIVILIALLAISVPSLLVLLTGKNANVVPAAKLEPATAIVKQESLPVDSVATVAQDTLPITPVAEEPYKFSLVDELAGKRVGAVTAGDTLLYTANASIETHIVAENETLTRIALKYYGDKRLWPYIVQYNRLADPNGLCKGMKLEIPRLEPVK